MAGRYRDSFGDHGMLRKRAVLTLMMYVVCGLTLTAHIAFADHHCRHHCHDTPLRDAAPMTLSAGGHCSFDHHFIEEHHEEAVDPNASARFVAPAMTPPEPTADHVDPFAAAVVPFDASDLPTRPGPPTPARAPPASPSA